MTTTRAPAAAPAAVPFAPHTPYPPAPRRGPSRARRDRRTAMVLDDAAAALHLAATLEGAAALGAHHLLEHAAAARAAGNDLRTVAELYATADAEWEDDHVASDRLEGEACTLKVRAAARLVAVRAALGLGGPLAPPEAFRGAPQEFR